MVRSDKMNILRKIVPPELLEHSSGYSIVSICRKELAVWGGECHAITCFQMAKTRCACPGG